MTRLAAVDPDAHRHLRVNPVHAAAHGDAVRLAPVVTAEFSALVSDFPIVLSRDPATGEIFCAAVLGFEDDENLFLDGHAWLATHKPLHLQRQPFFASLSDRGAALYIDLDSGRVGTRGERLFTDDGQASPYLDHIRSILAELLAGLETTRAFITRLLDLSLVEPAHLSFDFGGGITRTLSGLFAIDTQKLARLPDAAIVALHRSGDLERIHVMAASLAHLPALVRRKQARLAANKKTA